MTRTTFLAALFALAACKEKEDGDTGGGGGGGGGSLPTCDDAFSACGGDPVGSWTLVDYCFDVEPEIPDCPEATYTFDATPDGTLVVNADGTYSVDFTMTMEMSVELPKSCFPKGMTCDQIGDKDMTCSDAGDSCVCVTTPTSEEISETGIWGVKGTTLTVVSDEDGSVETMEFCATTRSLEILQENEEMGQMRMIAER